jgi:D-ribose pyranose/furanose isomerase RbsD
MFDPTIPWYADSHILTSLAGFASTAVIILLTQWKTKTELRVQQARLAAALQEHNNVIATTLQEHNTVIEKALAVNQSTTEAAKTGAEDNGNKLNLLLNRTSSPTTSTVNLVVKEEK